MIFNQLDAAINEYKNLAVEFKNADVPFEAFIQDKPDFFEAFIKNGFDIYELLSEILLNDFLLDDLYNRRLKSYKVIFIH